MSSKVKASYSVCTWDTAEGEAVHATSVIRGLIERNEPLRLLYDLAQQALNASGLNLLYIEIQEPVSDRVIYQLNAETNVFRISLSLAFHTFDRIIFNRVESLPIARERSPVVAPLLKKSLYDFAAFLAFDRTIALKKQPIHPDVRKVVDCENVFTFGLYSTYMKQLGEFLEKLKTRYPAYFEQPKDGDSEITQKACELVSKIADIHSGKKLATQENHERFITHLRRLLSPAKDPTPSHVLARTFALDILEWMYLQVDLRDDWWRIVKNFVPWINNCLDVDLFDWLLELVNNLCINEELSGITCTFKPDPTFDGNFPSFLWEYTSGTCQTRFIRMPAAFTTKFYEGLGNGFKVMDDLKCLLERLKTNGRRLCYVNLMTTDGVEKLFSEERMMSKMLHEMESAFDNLIVVSPDYNSDFALSRGLFSDEINPSIKNVKIFRDLLITHYQKRTCFQSTNVKQENWNALCEKVIDDILKHYFSDNETFNDQERKTCHLIVNIILLSKVLREIKVDVCNVSCRAAADRAPTFYTLLYLYQMRTSGIPIQPYLNKIVGMLLANAILTQNRCVWMDRINTFLWAAHAVMRKPPLYDE